MIIHIWMHWFWITTAYFKGFLLLAIHMISFICIFQPYVAEAGLLDHEILTFVTPHSYNENDSSQIGHDPNITLPIEDTIQPSESAPLQASSSTPPEEASSEGSTTPRSEDAQRMAFSSASDTEDTYKGGTFDVFQYSMKKFTKYSHPKHGKAKAKGKGSEETGGEERKSESANVVEENVNVNASIRDDGVGRSRPESETSEGSPSEVPTTDAPDLITTTFAENVTTSEEGGFEHVSKVEPNVTTESSGLSSGPTEDQKEVEVLKNDTLVIENKVEESGPFTTVEPFAVKNRVAAATSAQNYEADQSEMNAGSITGITLGILVIFSLFGAVSFVLYRRRYLNKPQVLHDKCSNLDSSGYIDETSLKENSEEMYSLDNDSFLNSLEAMTIQNYWTENVKHTKL